MAEPPKRDPRADPDDDDLSASARVDVVNVDRTDGIASAANTLRRDLARLQQQAAVVERTIEDHRKQQSDALERVERATEHALELQARLQQSQAEVDNWRNQHETALAELQSVRGERDDLERAIEAAKAAALDIGRMREETERVQKERDAIQKHAAKLESDLEDAQGKIKESAAKAANATTELEVALEKEMESATKAAKLVAEVANARDKEKESSAKALAAESELKSLQKKEKESSAKAAKAETELASFREKFERAANELQQANQAAAQGKMESLRAREDANEARDAITRLRDEVERERTASREEVTRAERRFEETLAVAQSDLEAARRELDETRTDITNATRELDAARVERDVLAERATMLERELEESKAETSRAEARVVVAERARSMVEEGIRQLRSEITEAFGRVRAIAPSSPPPKPKTIPPGPSSPRSIPPAAAPRSETNRTADINRPQGVLSPAAVAAKGTSFPPVVAEAPPLSIPVPPMPKTGVPDGEERGLGLDEGWPSPSQPPPAPSKGPPPLPTKPPPLRSKPPPLPGSTTRSAERGATEAISGGLGAQPPRETKPPSIHAPSGSIPPVFYPSVPPVATTSSAPNDVAVIGTVTAPSELFELLFDPETARDAVDVLRENPEWLVGPPPSELIGALAHVDYDAEGPVFELARAWEREALCPELIAALKRESDPRLREHGAWLLKHLGAPSAWKAIAELAITEGEPLMVRRWLLEALDRLAAGRVIGWSELGETVTAIAKHPDPSLRDGAVGVLMSLEKSDEKRRLLLDILRNDDDEVVLASAVHALASVLPVELEQTVVDRLLGHASARVQRSVKDFIERAKSDIKIN